MRKHNMLLATAAGLALVAAATLSGCAPTGPNYTTEQIKQYTDQATFHDLAFTCPTDTLGLTETIAYASPAYGPGSPDPKAVPKRTVADGPSIPVTLVGPTVQDYTTDTGNHFCVSPLAALNVGYGLGNLVVPGTHTRVFGLENNDALKLADVTVDKLNDVARTLVYKDGDDFNAFADRNKKFQEYVGTLVSILYQMTPVGVQSLMSTYNLHTAEAEVGIPDVLVNNVQEDWQALVFAWTLKGQCVPAKLFGVNVNDARYEEFNPSDYAKFCTPTNPPREGCVGDSCGGSNPPCTVNCNAKDPRVSVTPPLGTTQLPNDAPHPSPTPTPGTGDVLQTPHSDPSPTATPPSNPAPPDPVIAPPASTPAPTPIADPDAK
jgi:hypothetical protein